MKTFPFLFTVNFNKKNDHPLIHTFKDDLNVDNLKKFVRNLQKRRLKYDVFSELIQEKHEPYSNDGVRKISRKSFANFIADNYKRDAVILFYNGNDKIAKNF